MNIKIAFLTKGSQRQQKCKIISMEGCSNQAGAQLQLHSPIVISATLCKVFTSATNITGGIAKPDKFSIYQMLHVNFGQSKVIAFHGTFQH
jgi:hypothetical protein